MSKSDKSIKSIILQDLNRSKTQLLEKLSRFQKKGDSRYYKRRLDKIYEILKERCFYEGKPLKVLEGADFYQKIEAFMLYDKEHYSDEEIYELIAQVFRSLYTNFILAFLEDEDFIPLPYIGKIKIMDTEHYSEFHKMNVKRYYGIIKLDTDIRKELNAINKNQKIDMIQEVLDNTGKNLKDKIS